MTTSLTTVTKNYTPAKNMNPFFEVTRCPLKTTFNGVEKEVARDALFSPTGDLLGIVSPKYKLVKNQEVVNTFDEFFSGLNVASVTDKVNQTGGKWMREYILNDDKYVATVGKNKDTLKTKITIYNGYDGKTSVGMNFSAWRQICSNGMFGWKKLIGRKFSHFTNDILGYLGAAVDTGFNEMQTNFNTWEKWSEIPHTEKQFQGFIDDREYLSDKQKKEYKGLYLPIMNKYKESETLWGSYNVLTSIGTHYVSSRNKDVANDFSNGYRTISRVTNDFYNDNKVAA